MSIVIDGKPLGSTGERTDMLLPLTGIEYAGKSYVIVKTNPANYRIVDALGKQYNLPRLAPLKKVDVTPEHAALGRTIAFGGRLPVVSGDSTTIIKPGTPVRIVGVKGKWNNVEGLVAKINPTKYHVVVANQGVVSVSHGAVQPI